MPDKMTFAVTWAIGWMVAAMIAFFAGYDAIPRLFNHNLIIAGVLGAAWAAIAMGPMLLVLFRDTGE